MNKSFINVKMYVVIGRYCRKEVWEYSKAEVTEDDQHMCEGK